MCHPYFAALTFFTYVRVSVRHQNEYAIRVESLERLPQALDEAGLDRRSAILISDENVWNIHGESFRRLARGYWNRVLEIVLQPGETMKSLDRLSEIYDRGLKSGIDRDTVVIAFGGGVVGDLAGFAAATMLRGLPLVQVPTSLIAQVDSSIGGKTGINHDAGKNLIGAFHPPSLVFTDPALLLTLPDREFASGLAEVVKHALIADVEFARWLAANWEYVQRRNTETLNDLLEKAIAVKVSIVEEDVFEQGRRALLNFGHTFGHAIERVAGYGVFTHGEAVALGMRAATSLSSEIHPEADFALALDLIDRIPVPSATDLDTEALMEAMSFDKKVRQGSVRFIVLEEVGRAAIRSDVSEDSLRNAIAFAKTV